MDGGLWRDMKQRAERREWSVAEASQAVLTLLMLIQEHERSIIERAIADISKVEREHRGDE